jgi:PST family polysaccharide transporter
MINKAKGYISQDKYKKMISNFSYLSLINIANKVLPLIVIPYIVRTIGVEKYGVIIFVYAIMQYFQTVTKYSFSLTATKYISLHREETDTISKYFWTVIATQLFLFMMGLLLFIPIIFGVERFYLEKEVFLFALIFVFASDLIPLWFFQGIEDMKYIALFNIATKFLYAIAIFTFVQSAEDYIFVPLINSLSFLLVGIFSIYFVMKHYGIKFVLPSFMHILELLKEGKDIFLSNISVSFYTTMNTVLLGFLTNYTVVGIYGLAETLFGAYTQIIKTYNMVIYPNLARFADNVKLLHSQARKFFILYLGILIIAAIFLFTISGLAIELMFGEGHEKSILVLQILAISLILEPLGGFFTGYLAIKSQYKTIRKITFITMILNFIIIIPMIMLYEEIGVALAFLLLSIVQVYLNLSHNREVLNFRSGK